MNLEIYQIYYSEKTREILDPSFIPLDNTQNNRADWWEYWPIRNFLLNKELKDDTLYGFLSPRFHEKTHLLGADLVKEISNSAALYDVINLSPYFDQAAFYQNSFEQLASIHNEYSTNFIQRVLQLIDPAIEAKDIINTYTDTFYCNYFLAKKIFWKQWLKVCEKIFQLAENINSPLYRELNKEIPYGTKKVAFKVFLVERIASYIAFKNSSLKIYRNHYNSERSYTKGNMVAELHHNELLLLDSLKISYLKTKNQKYLSMFSTKRQELVDSLHNNKILVHKKPKRALIIAHYHKSGIIRNDTVSAISLLVNTFDRIIFISTGIKPEEACKLPDGIEFYSRPNVGYDFYSYKLGFELIQSQPDNWQISMMNTSFIISSPERLISNYFMKELTMNCHALTVSEQDYRHMQSYLMTFSDSLVKDVNFSNWWKTMTPLNEREQVIQNYEIGLSRFVNQIGYDFNSVFRLAPNDSLPNPTHFFYHEIIEEFGIVKIDFLKSIYKMFGFVTLEKLFKIHLMPMNLISEALEN